MTRETVSRNRAPESTDGPDAPQDEPSPQRSGRRAAILVVLVMLLFAAVAWALVATFVSDDESGGPEVGITLDELTSDPEALYDSTVVVSGEITDVVGERDAEVTARTRAATAFVIGAGDQRLLVVGAQIPQLAAPHDDEALAEGDIVQVTGTVRDFDIQALEEDLGTELADNELQTVDELPALIATAVNLIPTTARQEGEQIVLSADELTDSPGDYLAMAVTVRDVRIPGRESVLSRRTVALDHDILIVGSSSRTNLEPGFRGTVSGTLIEASTARLRTAIGVPRDSDDAELWEQVGIDEDDLTDYEYVLVADSIRARG